MCLKDSQLLKATDVRWQRDISLRSRVRSGALVFFLLGDGIVLTEILPTLGGCFRQS